MLEVTVKFGVDDLNDGGYFSDEQTKAAIAYFNEHGAGVMEIGDLVFAPSANVANVVQDVVVAYLKAQAEQKAGA